MIKFKYYSNAADFSTANTAGSILNDDIVFIGGAKTIHTHGIDFISANSGAYQLQVSKLGSATKPLYTSATGTFAVCSTYAGGTKVTLNGSNKGASNASFYAPTTAGTSGQILKSIGSGAPTWDSIGNVLGDYVATIGGKAGAITLKGDNSSNGTINLSIDDNKVLSASINGLGSAAYTESTAYATSAQGTKADNAMPKSGGTFTGAVTLSGAPTSNLHAATKKYVDDEITSKIAAADAMVFKGTLGTGGNVTALPTSGVTVGDTYKVITAGKYVSQSAKIGDLFIATASTPTWAYVPSGNENETTIALSSNPNVSSTAQTGAVTLGNAAAKNITDNSSNADVTSSDTNLITGRTLYYQLAKKGYTTNTGTITGITMNGVSKGSSGVVDLGTVITAHQDISGKANVADTVTAVAYDTTNKKLTQTKNGSTTDIVTAATIVTDGGGLKSHQTIKQNAITGATRNNYVACSTAAATAAKTGDVASGTPTLETGLHVFVKFTNANTADNPTLNINSKGAKSIYYDGAAIGTDADVKSLISGVCEFEYDGTQWHLLGKTAAISNSTLDTLWAAAS